MDDLVEEQRCERCDDEIIDSGTHEEEEAAVVGLCLICYESDHDESDTRRHARS